MDLDINVSFSSLEVCSYRYLQQVAKCLNLPSNVKKVHLIEMIRAKKYCSPSELNDIVQRVKLERQKASQKKIMKKRRIQGTEISSTRSSLSPPITVTPQRTPTFSIQNSPNNCKSLLKYHPRRTLQRTSYLNTIKQTNESDRVLRSFNTKLARPQYRIIEGSSSGISVVKAQNPAEDYRVKYGVQKMLMNTDVCVKKCDRQIVPVNYSPPSPRPRKRQRTVSGIYPLKPAQTEDKSITPYVKYIPTVGFRWRDGKITKINAVIHKPQNTQKCIPPQSIHAKITPIALPSTSIIKYPKTNYKSVANQSVIALANQTLMKSQAVNTTKTYSILNKNSIIKKPIMVTVQDVINHKIDSQITRNSRIVNKNVHINSNIDTRTEISKENITKQVEPSKSPTSAENSDNCGNFSVYYHKKIRAEHSLKKNTIQPGILPGISDVLPRINKVFSQFSEVQYKDLSQPLYVDVGDKAERAPPHQFVPPDSTVMLESLYNIKRQFLVNHPLQLVKTTSNTHCVYSTPVISSSFAHQPPAPPTHYNYSYERGDQYQYNVESETMPRLYDYLKMAEENIDRENFNCDEVLSSSGSSLETDSQTEANVTIPEMVDDALELISQDGDYMERIGMDGRMQCILCDWVGPKLLFENHIRKSHTTEIVECVSGECTVCIPLRAAVGGVSVRVIQHTRTLHALVCCYRDECLWVQLVTISETETHPQGRITIYNRLSGKPYIWEGEIPPISDTISFETSYNCLKLDIAGLDLLPNNVKLVNKELVVVSSSKVILGKSDLTDIDVVVYVKLFD